MFLRNDHGLELAGGGASRALPHLAASGRAADRPLLARLHTAALDATHDIDWVPDLGSQIGSRAWWRGLATLAGLVGAAWMLSPGFDRPLVGAVPAPLAGTAWEETRAQGIAPLAWGADTGRRMAASDLVVPLAEAPERPQVELSATLGEGDTLDRVLMRAGVGRADARAAADLIGGTTDLNQIAPGTRIALTLGRRASKTVARPLDRLAMRARFDLNVTLNRAGDGLAMTRQPIAIDTTPLRIQGLVGSSLYRSARAAGAPARVVESYVKALATRLSIGRDIRAVDTFDLIVERERAATGEVRLGQLLFAGIDQPHRAVRLVRWRQGGDYGAGGGDGDHAGWFDANGQTERRGTMGMPVAGRITSSFGLRMHPLLGFMRMHKGLDIGAPYGAPIYAVLDGVVQSAGRSGGYGNFVRLAHPAGLASGYGHMSRIAVARGQHVHQGQVIGYVGSTGLSTGPHLHWEVWRNGQTINPRSISFATVQTLSGAERRRFRNWVAGLLSVRVDHAG
ncbi:MULTISPECIES: M23 family metallopeptidase [unclassified Sphingomonas]|uniref:M23 family metallopeptidase n=1 Tax=unclassified Sphingomonas TaxID=196159 RepID=UPI000E1090AF|nr:MULTISPECIES: M23 family metallopeptidase [unclassified Sphingomonas]AXJ95219.1 M23 family peptidase [Sphingomonas sp. FARSPH]